jgi:hypothetical protein
MIFWSGYARFVRHGSKTPRIWIRRLRCRGCRRSHALIPSFLFLRRCDTCAAIGRALVQSLSGAGMRPVAAALGVPHTTPPKSARPTPSDQRAASPGRGVPVPESGGQVMAYSRRREMAGLAVEPALAPGSGLSWW